MLRLAHFIGQQVNRQVCLRTKTIQQGQQYLERCQQRLPWKGSVSWQSQCWYSDKVQLTDGEKAIVEKLRSKFPGMKTVEVSDISGGCGAMYQISIEAEEFQGKKTVQQHRLVNQALAEEIKAMHGLQLNTKAPS